MKRYIISFLLILSIFSNAAELQGYYHQKILNKEMADIIYQDVIRFSREFDVDPALITAIIESESNFNPTALSPKGAKGLMQIMPLTSKELGVNSDSISGNLYGGIKHFSSLLTKTNGDITLALAGYNAGYGNLLKYDGIPPFLETQNYIEKTITIYKTLNTKINDYAFNKNEWENKNNNVFGWDNEIKNTQ
ncbi:MAG: lytic transglycosylase domain-containing protein [Cetobacterium sp.]